MKIIVFFLFMVFNLYLSFIGDILFQEIAIVIICYFL